MGHYVYKYVYNGKIIYIGKTDSNLDTRINQHKLEDKFKPYLKSDIYYIELANAIMSDAVESELIRRYKPALNIAKMSDWDGLEFIEPEWKLFVPCDKKKTRPSKRDKLRKLYKRLNKEKTYELMAQYYCVKMLENISSVKEDDSSYEIEIPISPDDNEFEHCIPPYILVDNGKMHGGLSLGNCYSNDLINVVYHFDKSAIYKEFGGVEIGLIPRIKYMQNMFKEILNLIRD